MSHIIAARFTTFDEAQNATHLMKVAGYPQDDMATFFVNPPGQNHGLRMGGDEIADRGARDASKTTLIGVLIGAAVGACFGEVLVSNAQMPVLGAVVTAGIGAYIGSLVGALHGMHDGRNRPERGKSLGVRKSGVVVAVRVDRESEDSVTHLLNKAGGLDIEEADGQWTSGEWTDFDPVRPPVLTGKVPPVTKH